MEIADFDQFVRTRLAESLSESEMPPPRARSDGPIAVDIALLAFSPGEWAQHWAEAARGAGYDPRREQPSEMVVRQARRLLGVWTAPPEDRLTVAEVWLAINAFYPLLAAEIAPTASALDGDRSPAADQSS